MKNWVLILLAVAGLNFATLAPAQAEDREYIWGSSQWGSNPFDRNRDSAIRRVEEALRPMSLPQAAKDCLLEAVRRDPQGARHSIEDGDRFVEMQSGGGLEHNVLVRVGESQQERGRVPSARKWQCSIDGQTYTLVLPDICHNWAWTSEAIPAPAPQREAPPPPVEEHRSDCSAIRIDDAPRGAGMHVAVLATAPVPESECWAVGQGATGWHPWPTGCDSCSMRAFVELAETNHLPGRYQRVGRFRVVEGPIYIRVPREVAQTATIVVCIQEGRRASVPTAVTPRAWGGRNGTILPEWRWAH